MTQSVILNHSQQESEEELLEQLELAECCPVRVSSMAPPARNCAFCVSVCVCVFCMCAYAQEREREKRERGERELVYSTIHRNNGISTE